MDPRTKLLQMLPSAPSALVQEESCTIHPIKQFYVSNRDSNTLSIMSGTSLLGVITVGTGPLDMAFDSANGDIYVAD